MSERPQDLEDRTEVPFEDSQYKNGKVTPNTIIGWDEKGMFLYEKDGSSFTRTGDQSDEDQNPDQRPEDLEDIYFAGPTDFTIYHEIGWIDRVTVRRSTLNLIERHYPAIREHLPLRLLLQYLLLNRHEIKLNSTWEGEGSPLPAEMLAAVAGRLEQHRSRNFRAKDMLWWAKHELFDGAFAWTDWDWHPDSWQRRYRRVKELSIAPEVTAAVQQERKTPVTETAERVWFDTGTKYTPQSASDFRTETQQSIQRQGADILEQKGGPEVPRAIQTYLNDLPVDGFNKVVRNHIEEAYAAAERLSDEAPGGDHDPGVRHAWALLRAIEDCPKPFYEAKFNTPRLYAPGSLQLLNREVRAALVQDWTLLDLKSAQLAVCAHQWDVGPLLDFLRGGGDIWDELISCVNLPKPALKKALYAITFGARVQWVYGSPPSTIIDALTEEAGIPPAKAEEARCKLMAHPLMKALYEAREERLEQIERDGFIEDCFGSVLELPSSNTQDENADASVLTLLAAEAAATEMRLLWPAFEEVIGNEYRCKIMLYAFDGVYIKPSDPTREDLWVEKLQGAVAQQAEDLGIPTRLELEES
ncbi:hypothetical protein GGP86_000329 [Salinibacter ruber]|uniref:hypothetical protein n=1 Tax=Salinibacter ruber TaxID=146919 RepID=UPI00216AA2B3|nr:hypothetical protein [Salinibacter ruber]MCS3860581.1 hypothetical protein [Salinibacter ruber]